MSLTHSTYHAQLNSIPTVNFFDDCSQQQIMVEEDMTHFIPTPKTFHVMSSLDGNNIELTMLLGADDSWEIVEPWVIVVVACFTPITNSFSKDSVVTMLSPHDFMYHKYHKLTIDHTEVPNPSSVINSYMVNYFKDRPVSIIMTVHNKQYLLDNGFEKLVRKCKYLHQHIIMHPHIVPRYLFLSEIPTVSLSAYQLSPLHFLFRINREDGREKYPFVGNFTAECESLNFLVDTWIIEKTDVVMLSLDASVLPDNNATTIDLLVTCDFKFKTFNLTHNNHFIIVPLKDTQKVMLKLSIDLRPVIKGHPPNHNEYKIIQCNLCNNIKRTNCSNCSYYRTMKCLHCEKPMHDVNNIEDKMCIMEYDIDSPQKVYDTIHEKCLQSHIEKMNSIVSHVPFHVLENKYEHSYNYAISRFSIYKSFS